VQAAALEALAKRGDPSGLPAIERYMTDDKAAVRFTAAAAVVHLSVIKQTHTRKMRETPEHKQP
jgi:HEAT repeat protein